MSTLKMNSEDVQLARKASLLKQEFTEHLLPVLLALAACTVVLLGAFASPAQASTSSDDVRIISTDAGTTEILVALGQGESLVGIDVTSSVPDTLTPAKVGYHRQLAAEGLLSLAPTIVFGSEHIGPKETVNALKSANTQLVLQPTATDSQQLIENIQQVAEALKLSGDQLVDQVQSAQHILDKNLDKSSDKRLDKASSERSTKAVFLLYLEGRGLKQAGLGTSGDSLLNLLGLENVSAHSNYRSVSAEGLMTMQPEVILIGSQNPKAAEALLAQFPSLSHTPAVENNKVLFVDAAALVSGISLKAMEEAVRVSEAL